MIKLFKANFKKSIYIFLVVSILASCSTIGNYYDSSASIPRISINKKTDMKIIEADNYYYYNFGVIAATDIVNGKRLNYLLISPHSDSTSREIETYSLNNSSVLYIQHVQELIAVVNESIKVLSMKNIPEDGIYMTYSIAPENLVKKSGDHSIKYYPTFNYRFQCTKNSSSADLWVGEEQIVKVNDNDSVTYWNYAFANDYFNPLSESLNDFKSLLVKALDELKKR